MKRIFTILLITFSEIALLTSCQLNVNTKTSEKADNKSTDTIKQLTVQHFSTVIATKNGEEYEFTKDINNRVLAWKKAINYGISSEISLSNIKIITEDNNYFIIGYDPAIPLTSKIRLVLVDNQFFEYKYQSDLPNKKPYGEAGTCSGCSITSENSDNCQPKYEDNGWYCTDCPNGTCVKTVSANTGGIISN